MRIFSKKREIQNAVKQIKAKQLSIGFVPTMGALHEGHLSLVRQAIENNDCVIVSIFVNPIQFDSAKDLKKYPRTLDRDASLLKTVSKDILIYAPSVNDIYNGNTVAEHYSFDGLEHEMEGKFRKGHFDGVGTIVKRLFEIIKPNNAYFGEKDFQQLMIIKKLVDKHNIPVKIIGCEIYREANGLAMSSRNERLNPEYQNVAPFIFKTLNLAKEKFNTESAKKVTDWVIGQFAEHDILELEYFIIADVETLRSVKRKSDSKTYRGFIAVYAGDIRLIDNIALN